MEEHNKMLKIMKTIIIPKVIMDKSIINLKITIIIIINNKIIINIINSSNNLNKQINKNNFQCTISSINNILLLTNKKIILSAFFFASHSYIHLDNELRL